MNEAKDLIQELCPNGVKFEALSDIATIKTGATINKIMIQNHPGRYPVINSGREPLGFYDNYNVGYDPIGITSRGAGVGSITWYEGKYFRGNLNYSVTIKDTHRLSYRYLYHWLLRDQKRIQSLATYDGIPALNASNLKKLTIPVPPLAVQAEIVRILDSFTSLEAELEAELEARKKQYEYYRNKMLISSVDRSNWSSLIDVCESISAGGDLPAHYEKNQQSPTEKYPYPIFSNGTGGSALYGYTNSFKVKKQAVTISARGTIGYHALRGPKFTPIVRLITLLPMDNIITAKFLNYALDVTEIGHSGGSIPQLTVPNVKKLKIPVPPLDEQRRIASLLDNFDALVNDLSSGLPAEIAARRQQYEFYRDRLLSFKELAA